MLHCTALSQHIERQHRLGIRRQGRIYPIAGYRVIDGLGHYSIKLSTGKLRHVPSSKATFCKMPTHEKQEYRYEIVRTSQHGAQASEFRCKVETDAYARMRFLWTFYEVRKQALDWVGISPDTIAKIILKNGETLTIRQITA